MNRLQDKGENAPEKRLKRYISVSLALLLFVHFLGRLGYFAGWYPFVVADTFTLLALLILGLTTAFTFSHAYHAKGITTMLLGATALITLGQAINVLDGVPSFGGTPIPLTRSLALFKEPISAIGIVLFIASFYACILEVQRARQEALRGNDALEQRVAERTAELASANDQLRATLEEMRGAQQALAESETKYREVVQNANSIILRIDTLGRITFFNQFAQQFFGYSEPEILGRSVLGTITPYTELNAARLNRLLCEIPANTSRHINSETQHIRRNGQPVWVTWTSRPIFGSTGHLQEVLQIGNDTTERVLAERTVAEQRIQMIYSARMSALGVMAGGIAHEINNPLAVISMGAQQLEMFLPANQTELEPARRIRETIARNVRRIQGIIRALRHLSRDSSDDPCRKAQVHTIISDTLDLCQERFRSRGVALDSAPPPPELELECRPSDLCQVLMNLLNNAFDAVEKLPEKWIRLEVEDENTDVTFSVTDSGPGLSPEVREKAFIPFFTTKKDGHGTGLGLSISRRLVERHHGHFEIDADCPNTRFLIRLPKTQPSTAALEEQEESAIPFHEVL